jgi:hypothetical protein
VCVGVHVCVYVFYVYSLNIYISRVTVQWQREAEKDRFFCVYANRHTTRL